MLIKKTVAGLLTFIMLITIYGQFSASAADLVTAGAEIHLDVTKPSGSEKVQVGADPAGSGEMVLLTGEEGYAEWGFEVKEGGEYSVVLQYYPLSGRGVSIERRLLLDGSNLTQESGAQTVKFTRIWKDAAPVTEDNAGNQIRPAQTEAPDWREVTAKSQYGSGDLTFGMEKGRHVLRLESVREPMAIRKITLIPAVPAESYQEYAKREAGQLSENQDEQIFCQAENAQWKSHASLYAINDKTSAYTQPSDPTRILLNSIGGSKWKYPGQWITWSIPVKKAGYYTISLRFRQNLTSGQSSCRTLYIDGKLPFAEAQELEFHYDTRWQVETLGDQSGAYLFYLAPGEHQISMEVTIGVYTRPIEMVSQAVENLNEAYRQILMITGSNPDPYRDYYLDKELPEVMKILAEESARLKEAVAELRKLSGGKSGVLTASPERMYNRIDDMLKDTDQIPAKFSDFKEVLVSMGSWLLSVREQPLEIDYILLSGAGSQTPQAEPGLWGRFIYSVRAFIATFMTDYSVAGNQYDKNEALTVWMVSGTDQAQTLKQLIDNDFTPNYGIGVNLNLVMSGTLLSATLAGVGPDIALNCAQSDPVNYALRRAVVDLSGFEDYEEISQRFHPSSLMPFTLQNRVYALPETQSFPMLFYRKDILEELGLQKPETWSDVFKAIPVLQKKNMQFGIGSELNSFGMLLYQEDGDFYTNDGAVCILDSEKSVAAFKKWTSFYISYNLPVTYDFPTRFRTGEMPMAIVDYSMYNLLSVFAPEIEGLWEFGQVPGVPGADGEINRTVPSSGLATVIMHACKRPQEAWEFLKWWTSATTQSKYGTELEYVMGAAARYATANLEAVRQMPWNTREADVVLAQWQSVKGIPQVPGGYFLERQITFAFRSVVVSGNDPRESLLDYTEAINVEIQKKRKEFAEFLAGSEVK